MLRKIAPFILVGCLGSAAPAPEDPAPTPQPVPNDRICQSRGTEGLDPINFATNSARVQDAKDTLNAVKDLVDQGAWIRLVGHADDRGSEEDNQKLSAQRANAVKQQILALARDSKSASGRIAVEACGESSPVDVESAVDRRWSSRRVVVQVLERCAPPGMIGDLIQPYQAAGLELSYLIAMVPDPLESNVPREFDLVLASIIRAFELHGFQRRKAWLPWGKKAGPPVQKEGSETPVPPDPEKTPGVVFFQRDPNLVEVVLLVGESPVWGVRRPALKLALEIAQACTPKTKPLQLLGPTFSGSADSLRSTLRDWRSGDPSPEGALAGESRRCLKVISGSATNPDLDGLFSDLPGVDFKMQSIDDHDKAQSLFEHLALLGIERVALLVESSAYGEGFRDDHNEKGAHSEDSNSQQSESKHEKAKVVLALPFPMHIYAIRSAHAHDRENSSNKERGDHGPDHGNSNLKVDLAEAGEARAGLNLFDPHLTSTSYDLVLSRILDTLARSQVQAVGIVATDIKDRLFLADALSRSAPNLRLFTFEADELLTHPDFARATRGMLVASSHGMQLEWKTGGDEASRVVTRFANDTSQGVFEAVVAIIRSSVPMGKKDLPETVRGPCHYFGPNSNGAPAVKISAVGRGGLHSEDAPAAIADSLLDTVPRGSILVWGLLTVLLGGLVLWIAQIRSPTRVKEAGTWSRCGEILSNVWFYRSDTQSQKHQNGGKQSQRYQFQAMVLALLALVGLAYTVFGAPVLARWFASETDNRAVAATLMGAIALLTIVFLSRDLARLLVQARKVDRQESEENGGDAENVAAWRKWRKPIPYLATGLMLTSSYLGLGWMAFRESERALDLASGISPTLPILLLLGVPGLWVSVEIIRCHAFENRLSPLVDRNQDLKPLAKPGNRLVPTLNGLLRLEFLWLTLAVLLFPGLFLLIYYHESWPTRLVRGIEDSAFDFGISLVLVVSIGLVLEASFRYYRAWRRLRREANAWLTHRESEDPQREASPETESAAKDGKNPTKPAHGEASKATLDILVGQIRWLMLFATLGLVLILVALLTYPFEPDRVLALYISVLILLCAVTAAVVNWQIGRDRALNAIRGRESTFTFQRVARVAFYVGVPAAGLLAGRFPGTLDILMDWLEPILGVFS